MQNLPFLDVGIIFVYLLAMIGIGFFSKKTGISFNFRFKMLEMLQKSDHSSCFVIFILLIVNHYFLISG